MEDLSLKNIFLTKLNNVLNAPLHRKIIFGLFIAGISLVAVNIFFIISFVFKYENENSSLILQIKNTDYFLIIVGLILLALSTALLIYFNKLDRLKENEADDNEEKIDLSDKKIILHQYQEMLYHELENENKKYLNEHIDKFLHFHYLLENFESINKFELPLSIEIEFENKEVLSVYSYLKTDLKVVFPSTIVTLKSFYNLISNKYNIIEFINSVEKFNLNQHDFEVITVSWEQYLNRFSYDWTSIQPKEKENAEFILNNESVLWLYGKTCTGKTNFAIQLLDKKSNKFVYNLAFNKSLSVSLVYLLIKYGHSFSLLLDDLQTNYDNSISLINLINQLLTEFPKRNIKLVLVSWVDLYRSIQNDKIKVISLDSNQFIFYLLEKVDKDYRSDVLKITNENIALLDISIKLLKKNKVKESELKDALFKYLCPLENENELIQLYVCSILGTFDFEVEIDFVKNITNSTSLFDYSKMPTLKISDKKIFVGHRTIAKFMSEYIKSIYPKLMSNDQIMVRYLEYISIHDLWKSVLQIIGYSDNIHLGKYTPLWKLLINSQGELITQNTYDPSWKNTPSSMYFAIKTLSMLGLKEEYTKTTKSFFSKLNIIDKKIVIDFSSLQTTNDFIKIKEKMKLEDLQISPLYEKGEDVKPELMHQNWLFGLAMGLKNEIVDDKHIEINEKILETLVDTQLKNGSWYPSRVTWVTARVLIGLSFTKIDRESETINNAVTYLLKRLENGYCEAYTGGWNNRYETTSLCLEALTSIGFNCMENEVTKKALYFLLENRNEWMTQDNEIDGTATACLLIKNLGLNEDLFDYIINLSERNLSCLISTEINYDEEQSCKSTQIIYYIIDLCWFVLKQDLSGLLEDFLNRSENI